MKPKIDCRGRNGFFRLFSHETVIFSDLEASVGIKSIRKGLSPPIAFYGPVDDLRLFFQGLADELRWKKEKAGNEPK